MLTLQGTQSITTVDGILDIQQQSARASRFSLLLNGSSVLGAMRRLGLVIIPAIALVALSNLQTVSGGPLMYASCIAGCAATGPLAPACWAACIPVLAIPGP